MRLPKWLWRIIRSKRVHRFLAIAPFVAMLGVVIFYWGVNTWGQAKLGATRERMGELGIPVTAAERESLLPQHSNDLQDRNPFENLTESDTDERYVFSSRASGLPNMGQWHMCLQGGNGYRAGDLRQLFRPPPSDANQKDLADQLLQALAPVRAKLEPVVRIINDADHPLLFENSGRWSREAWRTSEVGHLLALHSFLLAKSGNLDRAVDEYVTVARLIEKWQQSHEPSHLRQSHRTVDRLNWITPPFIEALREHPKHLKRMDDALASVDNLQPVIWAEEIRLGECSNDFSQLEGLTNHIAFDKDWSIEFYSDWDLWRRQLGDWWWQIQPLGSSYTDLARDIDSLLPILRRSSETAIDGWADFAKIYDFDYHTEPRTWAFYSGYSDNPILTNEIGYSMWSLLDLRFRRLSIAAELHLHHNGAYPRDIEPLVPRPFVSPFDGDPIRMRILPDGRMEFKAVGATAYPDGTLYFDPTVPITFEYPPKP